MTTRPVAPSLRFKGSESLIGSRVCPIERCHSERRAESRNLLLLYGSSTPRRRTAPLHPDHKFVGWSGRISPPRGSPPRAPREIAVETATATHAEPRRRGAFFRQSIKALTSWMNMDGGRPSISTWRGTARFLDSLRSLGMTATPPRAHLTCRSPSSPCRRTTRCCRTRATDSTRRRCRRATCPPARAAHCSVATPRRCTSP